MGFNISCTSGSSRAAQLSSETFSAKTYMENILSSLQSTNMNTDPYTFLNNLQFLSALANTQNFSPTDAHGTPTGTSYDFSFLTQADRDALKQKTTALLSSFQMININSNNNTKLEVTDPSFFNITRPATLNDLFFHQDICHVLNAIPGSDDPLALSAYVSSCGDEFSRICAGLLSTRLGESGLPEDLGKIFLNFRMQPTDGNAAAENDLGDFLDSLM